MPSRILVIPLALAVAASVSIATPAFASVPAAISVSTPATLTLPDGDGFRDSSTITVRADQAISVDVTVLDATDTQVAAPATDTPLESASTAWSHSFAIPVTGLAAGHYTVHVARSDDPSQFDDAALVVGSGVADTVTLHPATTTLYPYTLSGRTSTRVSATVADETGVLVPFHGSLVTSQGSTHHTSGINSGTSTSATGTVVVSGLAVGTASLVLSATGATGAAATSAPVSLALKATTAASVSLSGPSAVYPRKDGYLDTAAFTAVTRTNVGSGVPVTGTIRIARGSTTVATWSVNSRSARVVWNGLNKGKVVGGTYTLTATIAGPQGAAVSAKRSITVSSKHLVTRTASAWAPATKVIKQTSALDRNLDGTCDRVKGGSLACSAGPDSYGIGIALISVGLPNIPSSVKSAEKYGHASARVSFDVSKRVKKSQYLVLAVSRSATSVEFPASTAGSIKHTGVVTSKRIALAPGVTHLEVGVALSGHAALTVKRVRVAYTYKALVN